MQIVDVLSHHGRLDVAMMQSLVRKEKVDDLVAGYGHVIVDECHHLPAVSFERVLSEVKARYLVGLTTAPQRRGGHDAITEMQLGPARFRMLDDKPNIGIQEIYGALANDEARNRRIVDDVIAAIHEVTVGRLGGRQFTATPVLLKVTLILVSVSSTTPMPCRPSGPKSSARIRHPARRGRAKHHIARA
jgi:hypothetical protein